MQIYENSRNPVLPLEHHFPDSEAHVFSDGRLYIYGSYDAYNTTYCSDILRVVSTSDMKIWQIHDVAFRGEQAYWVNDPNVPKRQGIDWSKPSPFMKKLISEPVKEQEEPVEKEDTPKVMLYAPDAIEKDGKYYLYFCMSDDSEGVAVSDSPVGPFADARQLDVGGIDPAIFVDKDGQAYYYWGQIYGKGAKLTADMMTVDKSTVVDNIVTEEEHFFHEGSGMRRRGEWYYMVYSNMERGKPTSIGYSMSRSPLGPFEYKGIIVDNTGCDPETWNDHGSIEEFNGQWYVFYHRSSRGSKFRRRLCIEPIYFNEDGTINEVPMTSQGAGEPFAPGETIYAWHTCGMTGSSRLMPGGEGEIITKIGCGDTAVFRYVKSEKPYTRAEIKSTGRGRVRVLLDEVEAGCVEITEEITILRLTDKGSGLRTLKLMFEEAEKFEFGSICIK